MATEFTPAASLMGGIIIGLSATGMLFFLGRIAGISGILGGVLAKPNADTQWRVCFLVGLILGGILTSMLLPESTDYEITTPSLVLILAGLLVGWGTRTGGGCTSGHGVCGVSRLSPRSLLATLIFMVTAMVTTGLLRHL